jgi:hypothetical protein
MAGIGPLLFQPTYFVRSTSFLFEGHAQLTLVRVMIIHYDHRV